MTPSEQYQLKQHLRAAAKILKNNTPDEQLQDFESIELAAREHMLETVGPEIGAFFLSQKSQPKGENSDKSKPA